MRDAREHRREGKRLTDRDLEGGAIRLDSKGRIALTTCPPLRKDARRGLEIDTDGSLRIDPSGCLSINPAAKIADINVTSPTAQSVAESLRDLVFSLQNQGSLER